MPIVCVDVPRVKGKMAERGFTITSMSDRLGINRNTLSLYLEKPYKMPYKVISNMADALCDTTDEAASIFLRRTYVKRKIRRRRGGERMACPACGSECSEQANFCRKCGTKLRDICDCWVKKGTYNCGQEKCPGYRLFAEEKRSQA